MPRPSIIAIVSILLLFVGWGVWHYASGTTRANNDDAIADLDGIEAVTPLFEPHKRGDSVPAAERGSSAEVWLTGVIEDDEPSEKLRLPRRISGGPSESSSLR